MQQPAGNLQLFCSESLIPNAGALPTAKVQKVRTDHRTPLHVIATKKRKRRKKSMLALVFVLMDRLGGFAPFALFRGHYFRLAPRRFQRSVSTFALFVSLNMQGNR
jgi:hypothetical protein